MHDKKILCTLKNTHFPPRGGRIAYAVRFPINRRVYADGRGKGDGRTAAIMECVIVFRAAEHNGIVTGAEKPRNAVQYLSPIGKGRGMLHPLWRLSGESRSQRRFDRLKARSAV